MPATTIEPRETALRHPTSIGDHQLTRWRRPAGRGLSRAARWLAERFGPRATLFVTLAVLAGLFALAAWAAGETYEAIHRSSGLARLDEPVLEWMVAHRSPGLNTAVVWFSQSGGPIAMPVIATVVTLLLARRWRTWLPVVLMVAGVAGSLAMTILGKKLAARVRPPLEMAVPPFEHSPSLPSGHSLNSIVIAGIVAYLIFIRLDHAWQRWLVGALTVVYVAAMGMSRVYLGHHWLSDVLMAWLLGVAWLSVLIVAHRLYLTARERAAEPTGPGEHPAR